MILDQPDNLIRFQIMDMEWSIMSESEEESLHMSVLAAVVSDSEPASSFVKQIVQLRRFEYGMSMRPILRDSSGNRPSYANLWRAVDNDVAYIN